MNLIIFIILICGEPDLVTIVEKGETPYFYYSEQLRDNRYMQEDLHQKLQREDGVSIIIPDERGICT